MSMGLMVLTFAGLAILSTLALSQIMHPVRGRQSVLKFAKPRMWLVLPLLAPAMLATSARAEGPASNATSLATARAAVKGLGETLKEQLVAAIKAGGAVAAVGVCRTIAPAIAEDTSRTYGVKVGRTSLKARNPANAPDEFERRVLEEFVRKIDAGADPASLEHAETVAQGDERVFRYMKAIPTAAEPCLTCHGSSLQPELKAEILRLYPNDQATGFKLGELRGAFTVTQKLK
jgi:hypothetical protein